MTHLDSMHICSKRSCWPLTSVDPSPRYADWSGSPRVCPHVALCVQVMASALYHRQTGWATRTRRSRELVAFVVLPAWRKDLNPMIVPYKYGAFNSIYKLHHTQLFVQLGRRIYIYVYTVYTSQPRHASNSLPSQDTTRFLGFAWSNCWHRFIEALIWYRIIMDLFMVPKRREFNEGIR